ncbi:hypothetical protein OJAV_G00026620 [Oryzias javanicus]|uniref:G-protein coupled receptors family 2 profile 2 domain-containing protein n=1 Tax=Oryzias javanicus TaxID=123683 RepID=A0A437DJC3_ORYJA|nr:hypothetical protein OJAV_G00026620 [Oryzias javanicus]
MSSLLLLFLCFHMDGVRRKAVLVALLPLLMPKLQAEEATCSQTTAWIIILNYGLTINVAELNSWIFEKKSESQCDKNGSQCLTQFTNGYQETGFNESYFRLNASVTHLPGRDDYVIHGFANYSIVSCHNSSVSALLENLCSEDCDILDLTNLLSIKDYCEHLFSQNFTIKKIYIKMERKIIHNLMENCENRNKTEYNLNQLSINIFHISDEALNVVEGQTAIQMEAPQLPAKNESFIPEIWIPLDALHKIPTERRVVALVSYVDHSQFQFNQEDISSMVLRIELLEQHYMQNLNQSITMTFRIEETDSRLSNNSKLQCRYFDEQGLENLSEFWKTDGCEATVTETSVTCECNHATPFAVLLIRDPIAEIHWMILSYISYIGCGLSAFFCALSFLIYIFGRKNKMDYSMSIHVSLSGALFLLNSTFLLTEWGATVELGWVCEFVAAFMHYSLLCSFTWMAIEALHLYLLLIKVFNTYYKHYLLKLSVVGWGVPGLIVAVSLGVKDFKQLYGAKELTMLDSNQTSAICWIIDDSFFYSLNLVYFVLIFIFNSGILMAVGSSICRMNTLVKSSAGRRQGDQHRFNASCRSGLTLLGLTCLLGTTWGLAFLGSGHVNYPVLYLFCVLNSLQGFFIFMWICFTAKRQRKRQTEEKLTSTPMRTSGVKSE